MAQHNAIFFFFFCGLLMHAASQQTGDVRLQGDPSNTASGRLEVYLEGNWTSICYDFKALEAQQGVAQAACRQIGFYDFMKLGNVTKFKLPNGTGTNKLADGDCKYAKDPSDAAQHILRCTFVGGVCGHGDDMAVQCKPELREDFPYDTMVDFVNVGPDSSGSLSQGFAQVYVNQNWGPVCNMKMDDAHAFCRQLSFTNALSVTDRNTTLQNPVLVDKFHCSSGSDSSCLRDCFDYPRTDQKISCLDGYSFVTCIFKTDAEDEFFTHYGTKSRCTATGSSNGGRVAGAVIGTLLIIITIAIVTAAVCYFVPGCYFNKNERGRYLPKNVQTKYNAI